MLVKKRFLTILMLVCVLFASQNVFADEQIDDDHDITYYDNIYSDEGKPYDYKLWERKGKLEQKVLEVGHRLLNANGAEHRVAFFVYRRINFINAWANGSNSKVRVFDDILRYIDNDDELAALLAHEIIHIKDNDHFGHFMLQHLPIVSSILSKHYEHRADTRGVDLMVNAGYNPLAMITFLNKISPEYHWFVRGLDYLCCLCLLSHPTGSKRTLKVYEYIEKNYPEYIEQGYDNIYYTNFLFNSSVQYLDIEKIKEKYNMTSPAEQDIKPHDL